MTQKIALITGANSGIGLEICRKLAENDWQIIAISRNNNNLSQIPSKNINFIQCDVSNYSDLQVALAKTEQKFDCIINNAGVAYYDSFTQVSHLQTDEMIEVNIKGFTNILEITVPLLQKAQKGTIINISSLADRSPRPGSAVYAATKAYVKNISDSLRLSLAKDNIRVMNIAPALIETPLQHRIRKIDKGLISAHEFALIIKSLIELPQHINIRDMVIAPTDYEG